MKGISQETQPGWGRRAWSQGWLQGTQGHLFQATVITGTPPGMEQGSALTVVSSDSTCGSLPSEPITFYTGHAYCPDWPWTFAQLHYFQVQERPMPSGNGQVDWKFAKPVL